MPFKNLIDDTSTTVSASTPGVQMDLRYRTTLSREALGIPVRFWVYASSTVANDTGTVQILDSSSSPKLTVPITGTTAKWYVTDGYLPAADAKYDAVYGGNTSGSLSVYAFSLIEFADISPLTGELSASIGVITLSADGVTFAGELNQSIGNITLVATGTVDVQGALSQSIGDVTISATGTVATVSAPTFQAAGTLASENGITDVTVAWPTHAADDVAILWVNVDYSSDPGASTLTTAHGFTLGESKLSSWGGGGVYVRLTWFWARATSAAMSSPVVAALGSRQTAAITTYRGCVTTGTPWDVKSVGSNDAYDTSVSAAGATTSAANCLVAIGSALYGTTGTTVGSWTNADLSSVTESSDATNLARTIATAYGGKAAAGAYGSTTATASASNVIASATVALKPA